MPESPPTLYDKLGKQWFIDLIDRFYDRVEADQVLRPMYPEDLSESRAHMVSFLIQFWGGPRDYSEQRGHPRLRMRHMPFTIGTAERDAWFTHMANSVTESEASPLIKQQMLDYFGRAATHMINVQE